MYDEFARTTTVGIDLKCQYDADKRRVEIETDLKTLSEDVQGRLQFWLVEDGVVAPQLFPGDELDKEYTHNHVLRAAINGDWGTELTLTTKNVQKEKTTYTLPDGIVPDRAWVVAFFYNDSGVLQAVRQKISLS